MPAVADTGTSTFADLRHPDISPVRPHRDPADLHHSQPGNGSEHWRNPGRRRLWGRPHDQYSELHRRYEPSHVSSMTRVRTSHVSLPCDHVTRINAAIMPASYSGAGRRSWLTTPWKAKECPGQEVDMFSRCRRRRTLFGHRVPWQAAPPPERGSPFRHGIQMLVAALVTLGLIGGGWVIHPATAATQPPLGFERWTHPDAQSGVDFGLTATQVFDKYAASLHLAMPVVHERKDKRLIDIEIHTDGSGLADYRYDVVWVKDEGSLALESWFVPGLTEAGVHELTLLGEHGIAMVDIERYPKGNEWRFAAILQRSKGNVDWDVLTGESLDAIADAASRQGLRVLDVDFATTGPLDCPTAQGQACNPATFDAVLVANSGSNAVETKLWLNMSPDQIATKQAQGYQVIDREDGIENVLTVWVKPGLPFEIQTPVTQHEVIHEHGHHGRVVDLEHSPTPYSIVNFGHSAAPPSPKVANPQQGDPDDARHSAKARGEKAKAKADRDRKAKEKKKAKNKKSGKRGKNGRGRGR